MQYGTVQAVPALPETCIAVQPVAGWILQAFPNPNLPLELRPEGVYRTADVPVRDISYRQRLHSCLWDGHASRGASQNTAAVTGNVGSPQSDPSSVFKEHVGLTLMYQGLYGASGKDAV